MRLFSVFLARGCIGVAWFQQLGSHYLVLVLVPIWDIDKGLLASDEDPPVRRAGYEPE